MVDRSGDRALREAAGWWAGVARRAAACRVWGASAGERFRKRERLQRPGSGMAWAGAPRPDGDRTGQCGATEDWFPAALASRPQGRQERYLW